MSAPEPDSSTESLDWLSANIWAQDYEAAKASRDEGKNAPEASSRKANDALPAGQNNNNEEDRSRIREGSNTAVRTIVPLIEELSRDVKGLHARMEDFSRDLKGLHARFDKFEVLLKERTELSEQATSGQKRPAGWPPRHTVSKRQRMDAVPEGRSSSSVVSISPLPYSQNASQFQGSSEQQAQPAVPSVASLKGRNTLEDNFTAATPPYAAEVRGEAASHTNSVFASYARRRALVALHRSKSNVFDDYTDATLETSRTLPYGLSQSSQASLMQTPLQRQQPHLPPSTQNPKTVGCGLPAHDLGGTDETQASTGDWDGLSQPGTTGRPYRSVSIKNAAAHPSEAAPLPSGVQPHRASDLLPTQWTASIEPVELRSTTGSPIARAISMPSQQGGATHNLELTSPLRTSFSILDVGLQHTTTRLQRESSLTPPRGSSLAPPVRRSSSRVAAPARGRGQSNSALRIFEMKAAQVRRIPLVTVSTQGHGEGASWRTPEETDKALVESLEQQFYFLLNDTAKAARWKAYMANETDCVMTYCISRGKNYCKFDRPFRACDRCTKVKRPCTKLVQLGDGREALGIFPLQAVERTTEDWKDMRFYVSPHC